MLGLSGIVRIFEEIEQRIVQSLRRNLSRHKKEEEQEEKQWSAWQAEKLRSLEKFRRENAEIMAEYTEQIDQETRQIMEEEFSQGVNSVDVPPAVPAEDSPAEIKPEPQFFGVDRTKVNKLIEDVTNLENNAGTAALRLTDDVYRQTVNRVQLAMSTGSMTLQQAIDIAVKDFLDQGINCIVYKDGRRVNIADYVRMALRTTATRAALQGKSAKFKALGYDTVQVSSYGMCSPTCKPWQGRIYIEDSFSDWDGEVQEYPDGILWGKSGYCGKWFPLLSSAIEKGLFHPNCRHTILLWRDGDPLPESVDNSDSERRYKLEQQQRALEREIRKAKRKVNGFTDPENVRKAKAELKAAQKKLKDFIDKVNAEEGKTVLRRDEGKEKVYEGEVPKAAEPVKGSAPPEVETRPPEAPEPAKPEPASAPEPEIKEVTESIPEATASEPEAPEPQAVEISIPASEDQNADYTGEKIPQKSEPEGADEGETVLKRDYGKEKVYEGEKPVPINDKPYTDVTQEYLDNATPGEGTLTHDKGCLDNYEYYKDENNFADWLHKTLGGDIHVNEEKYEYEGQKNPDYWWNGKLWDLKTPESLKGVNGRIKHGMHQIVEAPGGIMIDLRKIDDVSYEDLQKIINLRMQWVHDKTIDIMIVNDSKLIKIIRYKK